MSGDGSNKAGDDVSGDIVPGEEAERVDVWLAGSGFLEESICRTVLGKTVLRGRG